MPMQPNGQIAWVSAAGPQSAAEGLDGDDSVRQSCLGDGLVAHGSEQMVKIGADGENWMALIHFSR